MGSYSQGGLDLACVGQIYIRVLKEKKIVARQDLASAGQVRPNIFFKRKKFKKIVDDQFPAMVGRH